MRYIYILSFLSLLTTGWGQDCDVPVCMSIQSVNTGTLDIFMINQAGCSYSGNSTQIFDTSMDGASCNNVAGTWFNGEVTGFQFDIAGVTISSASGGTAEVAGFVVSTSTSTVLGFSLQGATISAGSGVLTTLSFTSNEDEICFGENPGIISVASSVNIAADWGDCFIIGCTDPAACNYNSVAIEDDGSCAYVFDECGVCGGDNTACWFLDISTQIGEVQDSSDVLGMHVAAEDGFNSTGNSDYDCDYCYYDLGEPPPALGNYISFYFPHEGDEWQNNFGLTKFTRDIRNLRDLSTDIDNPSSVWLSVIETNVPMGEINIGFDVGNTNLGGNSLIIGRDGTYTAIDIVNNETYQFETTGNDELEFIVCGLDNLDDNGLDECGNVCGLGIADGYNCDGVPELFSFNQSMQQAFYFFNFVTINDVLVESDDWVGAFNGDICVGARQWDISGCGGETCDLAVYGYEGVDTEGNMIPGDIPSFKIYDASEDTYYDAVASQEFPWANLGTYVADYLQSGDEGCTDPIACNYIAEATMDDGSCEYAVENYNCEGNCIVDVDCAGECGGNVELDECGVCGGDNSSCADCAGVPNGGAVEDCIGECGGSHENCPGWEDDPGAYQFIATIVGGIVLNINGEQMGDDGDMFAAFDATGNVRGVAIVLYPPFGPYQDTPVYEMQMRSNAQGDLLHFKYYDASENVVLDIIETYEFVINDIIGDVENPIIFNICPIDCSDGSFVCNTLDCPEESTTINYCLDLHAGANLISFYALPEDVSVSSVMSSLGETFMAVFTEGESCILDEQGNYLGGLDTISSLSGYWVIVSEADSLCIEDGTPTDPAIHYSLHSGANLISFPVEGSVEISSSLPDDIEGSVSGIIGESVAADNQPPWRGSLSALSGGKGYWMITTEEISFSFDVSTMSRIKFDDEGGLTALGNKEIHQSTQQSFYFIESIENIEIGDWILAYNGDVVIGARQWQGSIIDVPAMGDDGSDYTEGYIKAGSVPSFKILRDDELINLEGDIPAFEDNHLYMVSSLTEVALPEAFSLDRAYPNPFNPTTTLSFTIPVDSEVSLSIYNLQGREVVSLINGNMDAGYHSITWNADSHSSGVYFVKMVAGEYLNTQKLMLVK